MQCDRCRQPDPTGGTWTVVTVTGVPVLSGLRLCPSCRAALTAAVLTAIQTFAAPPETRP